LGLGDSGKTNPSFKKVNPSNIMLLLKKVDFKVWWLDALMPLYLFIFYFLAHPFINHIHTVSHMPSFARFFFISSSPVSFFSGQCSGSVPRTYGSGSCSFVSDLPR
jgi:hypothetical protein